MADLTWWQKAVFYQIYPRSFADGNGDGIGDFPGMTAQLDYLRDLGIDAVWLSPHYPSPFLDCGYDISDYTAVAPEYGTLDDFKTFLAEAHARGIRVILDLVLNHTSDQHPWFQESRASLTNAKRDWYIWRDGRDDGPPNNWISLFGGSAWERDPATGQYYYHAFLREQPDLNWRNPEVKAAMWAAVRFWLDLGVDGFRLDAIATIFEDPNLTNHQMTIPPEEIFRAIATAKTDTEQQTAYDDLHRLEEFQRDQPEVHELMRELRALVDEYPGDRVLVGENEDLAYHGSGTDELHLVFNFPLMRVERLTPNHIRSNQVVRLGGLPPGAWPCNTLGNHDQPRSFSRYGDGLHDVALARLHLALLLTLKGTPFLYNGEELGMSDLQLTSLSQLRDTFAIEQYDDFIHDLGMSPAEAERTVLASTRDRCRSPFPWRDAPNGGFCPPDVAPWLPANPNYADGVNAADEERDPASLLNFYRRLLHLRRATPALIGGDYAALQPGGNAYFAFTRADAISGQTCLSVLNFSDAPQTLNIDLKGRRLLPLFSSHDRAFEVDASGHIVVEPFEVYIAEFVD